MAEKVAKSNTRERVLSILGVVAVIVVIGALMIVSGMKKPVTLDDTWQAGMTTGATESPRRHYIMYTDIMCPYCDVFSRATMKFADEFEEYLTKNGILFEIRMTDMLTYSGSKFSAVAAEGAYCAASEGKFWDYYHGAIQKLWDDYHSKGIGDSKTSPQITDMTNDWWLGLAGVGLSDDWADCVKTAKFSEEIYDATVKTSQISNGLPYFNWDGTIFNGLPSYFETWAELKEFLDMGL